MNFITSYFKKPFPKIEKSKHKLLTSLAFGVFVFIFLAIFKPYKIDDITGYVYLYLIGFGLITSFVMLISFFLIPLIIPKFFNSDTWNIGKNLLFIIGILAAISVGNWGYNSFFFDGMSTHHNLSKFIFITVSVGIFPLAFLQFFIELYLNKANQSLAQSVDEQIHQLSKTPETAKINLKGENKNESLDLDLSQLICVKSEGNYAQVYFKNQDTIQKKIIRNSISNIEKQLNNFDSIYRCHRSYLVNLENVNEVTGNARNFTLLVDDLGFNIPVSRSFPKSILSSIT